MKFVVQYKEMMQETALTLVSGVDRVERFRLALSEFSVCSFSVLIFS